MIYIPSHFLAPSPITPLPSFLQKYLKNILIFIHYTQIRFHRLILSEVYSQDVHESVV